LNFRNTLISVAKGSTAQILSNIQSMGGNNTLKMEDAEVIVSQVANITAIVPSSLSKHRLVAGKENINS
jgi:hypothetical protein